MATTQGNLPRKRSGRTRMPKLPTKTQADLPRARKSKSSGRR